VSGDAIDWQTILDYYDIANPTIVQELGGTATDKILVRDGARQYVLKRRARQWSELSCVQFDHALNDLLTRGGFPTPAYLKTRNGKTWVEFEECIFEASSFSAGYHEPAPSLYQLSNLGKSVALLHKIGEGFQDYQKSNFIREDHPTVLKVDPRRPRCSDREAQPRVVEPQAERSNGDTW